MCPFRWSYLTSLRLVFLIDQMGLITQTSSCSCEDSMSQWRPGSWEALMLRVICRATQPWAPWSHCWNRLEARGTLGLLTVHRHISLVPWKDRVRQYQGVKQETFFKKSERILSSFINCKMKSSPVNRDSGKHNFGYFSSMKSEKMMSLHELPSIF